ncbi:MAG: glycosyltransferase [Oligoflexia bacterium]|nr:glycosyltransferase [Oligoflexia bacterium]
MARQAPPRILAFATLGTDSSDEARLLELLGELRPERLRFDRARKLASFFVVLRALRSRPALVCQEGTGIAGGAALLLGRLLYGVPYVISSGDAVGPFVAARAQLAGPLFALYEKLLCRFSSGFIGWTPYLAGRALSFGAPRAMTAPGWAPPALAPAERARAREELRTRLGIPPEALVIGIAGSLSWNPRAGYAYGLELVRALAQVHRPYVHALILGDGDGRSRLELEAGALLGRRIHLPGRVPREEVPRWLATLDVGSLPQSVDAVGSFRYTTKLPEYLAEGLPVVTGRIPAAYDLGDGDDWLWRLEGKLPWEPAYIRSLARLLETITPAEISRRAEAATRLSERFRKEPQVARVTVFLADLLRELA